MRVVWRGAEEETAPGGSFGAGWGAVVCSGRFLGEADARGAEQRAPCGLQKPAAPQPYSAWDKTHSPICPEGHRAAWIYSPHPTCHLPTPNRGGNRLLVLGDSTGQRWPGGSILVATLRAGWPRATPLHQAGVCQPPPGADTAPALPGPPLTSRRTSPWLQRQGRAERTKSSGVADKASGCI